MPLIRSAREAASWPSFYPQYLSEATKLNIEANRLEESRMTVDASAQIDILLKEYDVLTNHVLTRINHRWSLTGYWCAAIAAIASFSKLDRVYTLSLIAMLTLLLIALWFRSWIHIQRVASQIAKIEKRVNHLAGAELLEWESRETWGIRIFGL